MISTREKIVYWCFFLTLSSLLFFSGHKKIDWKIKSVEEAEKNENIISDHMDFFLLANGARSTKYISFFILNTKKFFLEKYDMNEERMLWK